MAKRSFLYRGVAAAALCAWLLLTAGNASAETLNEALIMAYTDNPTQRSARAELRGVDEGVAQARSGWRPNVDVNAGAGLQYTDSDNGATRSDNGSVPLNASLDLVQPL